MTFLSAMLGIMLAWVLTMSQTMPAQATGVHASPVVIRTITIKGTSDIGAILATPSPALAVLTPVTGGGKVIWEAHLAQSPQTLSSPYPNVLIALAAGNTTLFALRVNGKTVSSAIASHASGSISGDEGVVLNAGGFQLARHDSRHVGDVSYRFVNSFTYRAPLFVRTNHVRVPDYPTGRRPRPSMTVKTTSGNVILLRLEVAATEAEREKGLMNRQHLDPDAGMVFVFQSPTLESFWMENTYIPLTVAFIGADHRVLETQDMAALTTNLHTPLELYQYAVEANQGFFAANGIRVGDRVTFHLGSS
jgi:uncharacterized protein